MPGYGIVDVLLLLLFIYYYYYESISDHLYISIIPIISLPFLFLSPDII